MNNDFMGLQFELLDLESAQKIVDSDFLHSKLKKACKQFDFFNVDSTRARRVLFDEMRSAYIRYYLEGGTFLSQMLKYNARDRFLARFYHSLSKKHFLNRIEWELDFIQNEAMRSDEYNKRALRQKYKILLDLRKEIKLKESWDAHKNEMRDYQFESFNWFHLVRF